MKRKKKTMCSRSRVCEEAAACRFVLKSSGSNIWCRIKKKEHEGEKKEEKDKVKDGKQEGEEVSEVLMEEIHLRLTSGK